MSWWTGATHGTRVGRYIYNGTIGAWKRFEAAPNPDETIPDGALLTWNATNDKVQNLGIIANTDTTNPTATSRINIHGYLYATRVYNAVWNDIVDFIDTKEQIEIELGKAYCRSSDGHHAPSSSYMPSGLLGITSDTYGFGVGHKSDTTTTQLPIAIGGIVLAHVDKEYETGTPLTATYDGALTEMGINDRARHPERIIATYYRPEEAETWNGITVNGRHWVRVR